MKGMAGSLAGAEFRAIRAREHLDNLKIRCASVLSQEWVNIGPNRTGTIEEIPVEPIDPFIPITVGEIVYNMRAALDYVVYALARSDSGKPQRGTQFPIENTEKGFRDNCGEYLCGITSQHKALFEPLQPYNRCNWTRSLRDLSNADKHRHLAIVHRVAVVRTPINQAALDRPGDVNVNEGFAQFVAFENGTPVVDTLEILQTQVTQVIKSFEPLVN